MYVPAGHVVHCEEPALLYLPERQISQAAKLPPAFSLLVPAGQSMHETPEVETYWPVSHAEQDEACGPENVPSGQAKQSSTESCRALLVASSSKYVPAGHTSQVAELMVEPSEYLRA
jgi:hypothetical protein